MREERASSTGRKRAGQGPARAEFRSWASAALGALVLVLSGFLLGVAVGVVSEEPEIVASHLVGLSEQVAFEAPVLAQVSAQPVAESADAHESTASDPDADPAPAAISTPARFAQAAPAVSAPPRVAVVKRPALAGWAIQVGAFKESGSADALAESLKAKGFQTYLKPSAGPSAGRWRVRVGPLATRSEAERLARRLEREESLSTWVLSEGGS